MSVIATIVGFVAMVLGFVFSPIVEMFASKETLSTSSSPQKMDVFVSFDTEALLAGKNQESVPGRPSTGLAAVGIAIAHPVTDQIERVMYASFPKATDLSNEKSVHSGKVTDFWGDPNKVTDDALKALFVNEMTMQQFAVQFNDMLNGYKTELLAQNIKANFIPLAAPAGFDSMMFLGLLKDELACIDGAVNLHYSQMCASSARKNVAAIVPTSVWEKFNGWNTMDEKQFTPNSGVLKHIAVEDAVVQLIMYLRFRRMVANVQQTPWYMTVWYAITGRYAFFEEYQKMIALNKIQNNNTSLFINQNFSLKGYAQYQELVTMFQDALKTVILPEEWQKIRSQKRLETVA